MLVYLHGSLYEYQKLVIGDTVEDAKPQIYCDTKISNLHHSISVISNLLIY